MTAPRARRRRRHAVPRHRPHAGRKVDLAPLRAARRARRGHVGHPRALGRSRCGRLAGGRGGDGCGSGAPRRRDRRRARGPGPAPPSRRAPRLREFRDVHAPPGGPGGGVRLGDRVGRRRVALGPAHGPRGRAPRAHGGERGRPRHALPAATARPGWRAARHRLDRQGGQRPGEVGHPSRRALRRGDDDRAGGGDDPHAHRGDAAGGGRRPDGRALGRGSHCAGPRLVPRAGGADRARRPLRVGLLRGGGVCRARERRRRRRRLQRTGPARLRQRPAADGRVRHPRPRRPRYRRRSGRWPGPCTARRCRPARSPRSTRFRSSPSPPPSPRERPSSPTSESSGSRRSTGSLAVADMVEAFGARATIDGDTLSITGVGGPLRGARFDSQGDHRMAMAAAVAALAARPGERSLITGFGAVETSYPTFADDMARLADGAAPPRPLVGRHRRARRRRQVDRVEGGGRATGRQPARYRRHVPGGGRPRPGAGDAARRQRRGGGARRGLDH